MRRVPTRAQATLLESIVAAIYGIVDALLPVINTVGKNPIRPWQQRAKLVARFNRILQELLALTGRIDPATLSPNPSFPPTPPRAQSAAARVPRQRALAPRRNPVTTPAPFFSARRVAQRLATLLARLVALAGEANAMLPADLRGLIATAATLAGCHALRQPHQAWESKG